MTVLIDYAEGGAKLFLDVRSIEDRGTALVIVNGSNQETVPMRRIRNIRISA